MGARGISDHPGARCHACIGGTSLREDARSLRDGQHIVIGTPGRVMDLLERRWLEASAISILVLDEADEMLSIGFKDKIYDIFKALPADVQACLFSATMPKDMLDLTARFMRDPVQIMVKKDELTL